MNKTKESVTCLGRSFNSDDERREYFREELRKKLPVLKKIEGFPIGEDDDIIALSDPPYYTACPNPWLNDFIDEWEEEKRNISGLKKSFSVDVPYASDVKEGKYDPMYLYHPYLTKVPHKAIMKFILHYTQSGDIIIDNFAGTGMTGVAARLCGNLDSTSKYILENEFANLNLSKPVWGRRKSICCDISPLASFISYNYNANFDIDVFESESEKIIDKINEECLWMYQTEHTPGKFGIINYTLWSDIFVCQFCNKEIVFWEDAVEKDLGTVNEIFNCPHCNSETSKKELSNAISTYYDDLLHKSVSQDKIFPVLINYTYNGKRYQKKPDKKDFDKIDKIQAVNIPYWVPIQRMPEGDESRRNDKKGITHVHQFYSKRNLYSLAKLKSLIDDPLFNVLITKVAFQTTLLYRFTYQSGVWGAGGGPLSGTLYVPSLIKELNIINQFVDAVGESGQIDHLIPEQIDHH